MGYRLFRYSGSKEKFPTQIIPPWVRRIVEPFCGSCGFSLQYDFPCLGIDANKEIIQMLQWLQTKPDLAPLKNYEGRRVDVRTLPLSGPEKTYLRVNAASVCVGQLSSWTLYPQHILPIGKTVDAMSKLTTWSFMHGDYTSYRQSDGDLLFIDPPYLGTLGNYGKNEIDFASFIAWVKSLKTPFILTYKEPILEIGKSWECWLRKKIPNMRRGGTSLREDWFFTNILPWSA